MARISKELQELNKMIDEELKIDEKYIENIELDKKLCINYSRKRKLYV